MSLENKEEQKKIIIRDSTIFLCFIPELCILKVIGCRKLYVKMGFIITIILIKNNNYVYLPYGWGA